MSQEAPCVLIVSSDYAQIRVALRAAGYSTAGLPDAESARVIFDSMHPAAVVSDVELTAHGRRTFPYFVRVLSRHPATPVIGIAGPGFSQDADPPAERFDALVTRPLRMEELVAAVGRLLPPRA